MRRTALKQSRAKVTATRRRTSKLYLDLTILTYYHIFSIMPNIESFDFVNLNNLIPLLRLLVLL